LIKKIISHSTNTTIILIIFRLKTLTEKIEIVLTLLLPAFIIHITSIKRHLIIVRIILCWGINNGAKQKETIGFLDGTTSVSSYDYSHDFYSCKIGARSSYSIDCWDDNR